MTQTLDGIKLSVMMFKMECQPPVPNLEPSTFKVDMLAITLIKQYSSECTMPSVLKLEIDNLHAERS